MKWIGYMMIGLFLLGAILWGVSAFLRGGWWFLELIPAFVCLWLAAEFFDAVYETSDNAVDIYTDSLAANLKREEYKNGH